MTLSSNFELEINESKYLKLKSSRDCLSGAFSIEEKYDLLISNFLELEKECLNITCEHMLKNNDGYSDFFDIRARLNRRVVNLLTASRLYMDHLGQHVKACLVEKGRCNDVKALFSLEYDSCFEYRFMEALRNYVQHRGLAIHSNTLGSSWTSMNKKNGELEYKSCIFTHKDEISSDKSFKRTVANEMPEKVNILLASRKYISSISKVHGELRQLISDNVITSRNIISEQIECFKKQSGDNSIALAALKINQDNEVIERVNIILDWDDVRLNLENKNKLLYSLGQSYVSSSAYNKPIKRN
ncbi:hypothetical protein [Oceanospirillum multiglobuliferum]|uniref:Uncharacterized protein n=1 Tax=Oceanospirillum multiglobuliferum TaxID=64969 RepID=A0A1V4T826_9GAMM|nr:hypothetical protein [Oceanospirillum multiglobuliferum]OPX56772.1 hypothetical protein BTE48_02525 [Oceanospirillum multiglobuliferum]